MLLSYFLHMIIDIIIIFFFLSKQIAKSIPIEHLVKFFTFYYQKISNLVIIFLTFISA